MMKLHLLVIFCAFACFVWALEMRSKSTTPDLNPLSAETILFKGINQINALGMKRMSGFEAPRAKVHYSSATGTAHLVTENKEKLNKRSPCKLRNIIWYYYIN
jgi:hypothetical protein